jgi:integrase
MGGQFSRFSTARENTAPFVLYTFRHTFLTRLGAETGDPYKVMRAAGHGSIVQSMRYVHISGDSIQLAMEEMGTHKNHHNPKTSNSKKQTKQPVKRVLSLA